MLPIFRGLLVAVQNIYYIGGTKNRDSKSFDIIKFIENIYKYIFYPV